MTHSPICFRPLSGAEGASGHLPPQTLPDPHRPALRPPPRVQLRRHSPRARRRVHASRPAGELRGHVHAALRVPLQRLHSVRQLLAPGL